MDNDIFNQYSTPFAWVTPYCVADVYEETSRHVSGAIADCGCGPCKITPYLVDNPKVLRYCGFDYSPEMVTIGQQLIEQLKDSRFHVQCASVEEIKGEFDCAVSLQSYYAWTNPEKSLKCIYDSLVPGGKLVLATVNNSLDIDSLLKTASRDWLLNPLWQEYATHNRQIVSSMQNNFKSLDELIGSIRRIGFKLQEAHTRYYNGGLSFIVATK